MRSEVTFLGTVVRVVGSKVFVELSDDLPSSTPIINGKIHKIGQVGSFVKIPLGTIRVFAIVTMVGANPYKNMDSNDQQPFPYGNRWLEIQLIGEAYGEDEFQRGVSIFPTIDDEVHIVTDKDLAVVYATTNPNAIKIGTLAASEGLPAYLDIDKLLTRHSAIIGSTGTGKSNTVTAILKGITDGTFEKAKIILIDPHSEYHSALGKEAKVFSIDSSKNPLKIPFWGLSYNELALILFDKKQAADSMQDIAIKERIFDFKARALTTLKSGKLDPHQVTVDSPIPFDVKQLWYDLYNEEFATVTAKQDFNTLSYKSDGINLLKGDVRKLIPPEFNPPGAGSAPPFKFKEPKLLSTYINQLGGKLRDNKLNFLFEVDEYDGIKNDLGDLLNTWLNHDKPITVLDLGGVPFEIMDLVVGLISRILFESAFWGRYVDGIGRQRPILMVFEEAHSYLPKGGSSPTVTGYASRSVRRICKEGRKYGIGALVISQRPSDLDETILSQCGTFITLRLSNTQDQGIIGSAMPDNLGSLSELLPSLRTGEAIIVGESVKIPSRVRLPLVTPRPDSSDPEPAKQWKVVEPEKPDYNEAIDNWRKQTILKH
jgi:uncharacterized protein